MRATSSRMKFKALGHLFGQAVRSTVENGRKAPCMEGETCCLKMAGGISENSKTMYFQDMAYFYGQMAEDTKGFGKAEYKKVKASIANFLEGSSRGNGSMEN